MTKQQPSKHGAATFSQRRKAPPPDLKDAVKTALSAAAERLEKLTIIDLFGHQDTSVHFAVYEEARQVAINYIRMGAR